MGVRRAREVHVIRVSTKGRYGLRAMVDLAAHGDHGPVQAADIARRQGVSSKYSQAILAELRAAGLVRAIRGPRGGFRLARPATEVTALDVVAALEGDLSMVECVADAANCERAEGCATRQVWSAAGEAIRAALESFTIDALADGRDAPAIGDDE